MALTRDTFGFAMKATSIVINGNRQSIFKDPKTDSGTKKSAKGLLRVEHEDGRFVLYDEQTEEQEKLGLLEEVYVDGKFTKWQSFDTIKETLAKN